MSTEYKVLIVGGKSVGKSAFTVMLIQGIFVERYDATVSDSYRKFFNVDEKQALLDFNDVSYTEMPQMRTLLYRSCDMCIIMYSITDERSLEEARTFYHAIQNEREEHNQDPMPIALFGNKNDKSEKRQINTEHGAELAASLNCLFYEGSVKANINLTETIEQLVRMRWKPEDERNNRDSKKSKNNKSKNKSSKRKGCILAL